MKSFLQILLITISAYVVLAVQENVECPNYSERNNIGEYGDFFEGDMMLTTEQMEAILNGSHRNGAINEALRWPDRTLFYEIDPVFNDDHVRYIEFALITIQTLTCIRFARKNEYTKDYVYVTGNSNGCYSWVGRKGGIQILNLDPDGCLDYIGIIMHEFIHALGFHHQQSASNRDDYVEIFYDNIKPKQKKNFLKYENDTITDFGVPYDYDSVMHYDSCAFSKNGKKTIIPLKSSIYKIGQRTHLSLGDIIKLNKMYNCFI